MKQKLHFDNDNLSKDAHKTNQFSNMAPLSCELWSAVPKPEVCRCRATSLIVIIIFITTTICHLSIRQARVLFYPIDGVSCAVVESTSGIMAGVCHVARRSFILYFCHRFL